MKIDIPISQGAANLMLEEHNSIDETVLRVAVKIAKERCAGTGYAPALTRWDLEQAITDKLTRDAIEEERDTRAHQAAAEAAD